MALGLQFARKVFKIYCNTGYFQTLFVLFLKILFYASFITCTFILKRFKPGCIVVLVVLSCCATGTYSLGQYSKTPPSLAASGGCQLSMTISGEKLSSMCSH